MEKLTYALKNNVLVSINDVVNGKKCDCICPACGSPLVARKGHIKVHHFAHASNKDCSYGYETSLHLLSKKIIEEAEFFILPKEIVNSKYFSSKNMKSVKVQGLNDDIKIKIDRVEVENLFDDIKPDLIIYSGTGKYFVEIYVTHKIDDDKRRKIKNKGIDTIEINLSNYKENIDEQKLRESLLSNGSDKYWVYNKKIENIINELCKKNLIKTDKHGMAWHTEFCPKNERMYFNKSYANVIDDCLYCENFYDFKDDCIVCSAIKQQDIVICQNNHKSKKCPKCNSELKLKNGKNGKFFGCSNYPKCNFTMNYNEGMNCPKCNGKLVVKYGVNGKFYGCENYPKCNYTTSL